MCVYSREVYAEDNIKILNIINGLVFVTSLISIVLAARAYVVVVVVIPRWMINVVMASSIMGLSGAVIGVKAAHDAPDAKANRNTNVALEFYFAICVTCAMMQTATMIELLALAGTIENAKAVNAGENPG